MPEQCNIMCACDQVTSHAWKIGHHMPGSGGITCLADVTSHAWIGWHHVAE